MYRYTMEFEINEFIRLYLINSKTEIFIKNERLMQCKQAVLNIPLEPQQLGDIETVNDLIDRFKTKDDYQLEEFPHSITPEEEFWAHCSNFQFWYEQDYDTRWMDRNIAFPLLKILCDKGDPLANRVFLDEIIKSIETWNPDAILFLSQGNYVDEGYMDYVPNSLFWELVKPDIVEEELESLKKLFNYTTAKMYNYDKIDEYHWLEKKPGFKTQDRHVIMIKYEGLWLGRIPNMILEFEELKTLNLKRNLILEITSDIYKLNNLVKLDLSFNQISQIPESIGKLKKLKVLNLMLNKLRTFSARIDSLKSLDLSMNKLKQFPDAILEMKNLEILDLSHNEIRTVPSDIIKLKNLKELNLSHNNIKNIECVKKMRIEKLVL